MLMFNLIFILLLLISSLGIKKKNHEFAVFVYIIPGGDMCYFLLYYWYYSGGSWNRLPFPWLDKVLFISRSQWVKLYGTKSQIFTSDSGVPQGEHLSPILFSLFINSVRDLLKGVIINVGWMGSSGHPWQVCGIYDIHHTYYVI